jgi:plastocyanin
MKHLTIILVVLVSLLLAACGGSGSSAAQPDSSGNITIEMSESAYAPDDIELKVGQQVIFTLMNKGEKDHELMIGQNVMMMDGVPNGFEHDMFEGMEPMVMKGEAMGDNMENMDHDEEDMEDMDHAGFMVLVPQGSENTTVTFTVTEDMVGEWEMGCFEDDGQHYDDGMKGKLVVKSN